MNKWLFHQNGFTRTSLSATLTRVSNFVEENVCVFFYIVKAPLPGAFSHALSNRLNLSIAMWDRFFRQRTYIGITLSCMPWYVRNFFLTYQRIRDLVLVNPF